MFYWRIVYIHFPVCVKVVSLHVQYVRPSPCDDVAVANDSFLTEECRIQTSMSEDAILNAHPLELVLDEVSQSVALCARCARSLPILSPTTLQKRQKRNRT